MSDASKGHRRETAGVDGRSINQFALRADEYLQNLRRKLLSHSGYSYSDLKAHPEPKDSGGHRVICIPTVADRIVQRAILEILSNNKEYKFESDISFGFLKNRTVEGAVLRATEFRNTYPWAYKTDISKFFDSIDRTRISDLIHKNIRVPSLQDLITRATECEIKKRDSKQNQGVYSSDRMRNKEARQQAKSNHMECWNSRRKGSAPRNASITISIQFVFGGIRRDCGEVRSQRYTIRGRFDCFS